jgi:hypothetical protein
MAQSSKPKTPHPKSGAHNAGEGFTTHPELIMVANPDSRLHSDQTGIASAAGADVGDLTATLKSAGAKIHPLFGESEERMRESLARMSAATGSTNLPDLSVYYAIEAPEDQLGPVHTNSVAAVVTKKPPI